MSYPQPPFPQYVPPQPPKKRRKWPWVVGGIAAVVVLGSAIGAGGGSAPASGPIGSVEPSVMPVEAAQPTGGNETVRLGFGESHTWKGGETITVSAPEEFTDSNPYLSAPSGKRYASVDVSIKNNGNNEYQVMQTKLTVQHNGRAAQQNYLAGDVLPDVQLPPGGETTFTSVYEVGEETGELQVSVQPNMFASNTVYFTGQF